MLQQWEDNWHVQKLEGSRNVINVIVINKCNSTGKKPRRGGGGGGVIPFHAPNLCVMYT